MTRELVAFILFTLAFLAGAISLVVPTARFPNIVLLILTLVALGFAILYIPGGS